MVNLIFCCFVWHVQAPESRNPERWMKINKYVDERYKARSEFPSRPLSGSQHKAPEVTPDRCVNVALYAR